jgi:hypothetical protein
MERATSETVRTWTRLCRLTASACLGAPLLLSGCMQFRHSSAVMAGRQMRTQAPVAQACYHPGTDPSSGVVTGAYQVRDPKAGSEVVPAGVVVAQTETKPAAGNSSRMVAAGPRGGSACNYGTAASITHLPA